MRTVTIEYRTDGFSIADNDGQFVDVEYGTDRAFFVSYLHGDETALAGTSPIADAEMRALALMGIPNEEI